MHPHAFQVTAKHTRGQKHASFGRERNSTITLHTAEKDFVDQ
ncbi:hypothetical protein ID866_8389 [Astraeus odoratus]|nr:hypothetical protein ID866_8389 [Astraeus odoratus]